MCPVPPRVFPHHTHFPYFLVLVNLLETISLVSEINRPGREKAGERRHVSTLGREGGPGPSRAPREGGLVTGRWRPLAGRGAGRCPGGPAPAARLSSRWCVGGAPLPGALGLSGSGERGGPSGQTHPAGLPRPRQARRAVSICPSLCSTGADMLCFWSDLLFLIQIITSPLNPEASQLVAYFKSATGNSTRPLHDQCWQWAWHGVRGGRTPTHGPGGPSVPGEV